ncbi:MAG: hypothetical protein AAF630_07100 [Cyanobacteria bacterium P01_C01_bin.38]
MLRDAITILYNYQPNLSKHHKAPITHPTITNYLLPTTHPQCPMPDAHYPF